ERQRRFARGRAPVRGDRGPDRGGAGEAVARQGVRSRADLDLRGRRPGRDRDPLGHLTPRRGRREAAPAAGRPPGRMGAVTTKPAIPDVLAARYAAADLVALWSPEEKVRAERRLWLAVLRAQRDLGVPVPDGVVEAYERVLDQV